MIQIIKRNEGFKSEKETLDQGSPQVSYNDHGHLCIRLVESDEKDTLIVLNKQVSDRVINFIRRSDLPF